MYIRFTRRDGEKRRERMLYAGQQETRTSDEDEAEDATRKIEEEVEERRVMGRGLRAEL